MYALFTPAVGCTIIGVKLGDDWIAASEPVVELVVEPVVELVVEPVVELVVEPARSPRKPVRIRAQNCVRFQTRLRAMR